MAEILGDTSNGRAPEDVWIVDINNRLDEQFPDLTDLVASEEKPSICWIRKKPERFHIGVLLLESSENRADDDKMWEYVAFIAKWLGLDVNSYLTYMKDKEGLVRSYYCSVREESQQYCVFRQGNHLMESLLVAACFLAFAILLLQKISNGTELLKGNNSESGDRRSLQFSVLYRKIMVDHTMTKVDMLSIGNQIPWFAVEAVFTHSNLRELFGTQIHRLAMTCFDDLYPRVNRSKVQGGSFPSSGFKHLLHIFHWTRTPDGKWPLHTQPEQGQFAKRFAEFYIPNATNLLESATSFERLDSSSIDVIYVNRRISGVMKMTPLHIFPYSLQIFRNLLHFEQRHQGDGLPVTAHIACMKSLLQNKEDVKLLQKNGIVQNTLEGEKDVLYFMYKIRYFLVEEVGAFVPDELNSLSEEVIEHHERGVSVAYSELKRQFCPNRWVIISVIAAFLLFVLTFIQTLYSVLAYYKGS